METRKHASVRQELARTRKQISIRRQDIELLAKQIKKEAAAREVEIAQFEKLRDSVGETGFKSLESRAIFG